MIKRIFILPIAIAALVTASAVFAEDQTPATPTRPAGAHAPGERLKALTDKLGLTDDQQAKIKAIFEANAPKLKEVRADTTLSRQDKRKKLMELRKSEFEQIRAVLTPEQQEKLKESRPGRRGKKAPGSAA